MLETLHLEMLSRLSRLKCDPQEQDQELRAGWGSCKSCDCTGYVRDKQPFCRCGHHYNQHH